MGLGRFSLRNHSHNHSHNLPRLPSRILADPEQVGLMDHRLPSPICHRWGAATDHNPKT